MEAYLIKTLSVYCKFIIYKNLFVICLLNKLLIDADFNKNILVFCESISLKVLTFWHKFSFVFISKMIRAYFKGNKLLFYKGLLDIFSGEFCRTKKEFIVD